MAEPQQSVSSKKKNFVVHSEARQIISRVTEKCDNESKSKALGYPISQATKRAADYCGKSENFIIKLRKESKMLKEQGSEQKFSTPGKRRDTRKGDRRVFVDDMDKCVIRQVIKQFYVTQKVVPSAKKLLPVVKERIHFPWGRNSLINIMKSIGFRWRKCQSKRKVLIEKPDIVLWRYKFLVKMKALRKTCNNIFYLDETWVDSNISVQKCWQSSDVFGVQNNYSAGNRLILLHAGSKAGFLNGGMLLYKAGTTSGDYHGQMNHVNFEKWVREKLVPNLPDSSVVVMDNAPYHSVLAEKVPTKYSIKKDIVEYLQKKGVHCDENMRKEELVTLLAVHKPRDKVFRIDQYISSLGHTVVRLPPYMCDLNPIELVWAQVKNYVRERNCDGILSLNRLQELTEEAIASVTPNDWNIYCNKIEMIENEYWKNDGIVSDVTDRFIISIGGDGSNSDSDSEFSASDDCSDSDADSDLAQPLN